MSTSPRKRARLKPWQLTATPSMHASPCSVLQRPRSSMSRCSPSRSRPLCGQAFPAPIPRTCSSPTADGRMVLVVAKDDTRVDLKALAKRLSAGRLSFGKPERLEAVLGVSPGSVTPFALINASAARRRRRGRSGDHGFRRGQLPSPRKHGHHPPRHCRSHPLHQGLRPRAVDRSIGLRPFAGLSRLPNGAVRAIFLGQVAQLLAFNSSGATGGQAA